MVEDNAQAIQATETMKAFSHFVGSILTLAESSPVDDERLVKWKRLMEKTIYASRNEMMDGRNASIVDDLATRINTISSIPLTNQQDLTAFSNAVSMFADDLKKELNLGVK